jgi:HPt (histidine-containing phosphotransfer) domain-containing protein
MEQNEKTALDEAIDRLWTQFLPQMRERVAILETAASGFAADKLSAADHVKANDAAHKLAGALGSFGLTRGTVLARELEIMYSRENGADPVTSARLGEIAAELRAMVENRK